MKKNLVFLVGLATLATLGALPSAHAQSQSVQLAVAGKVRPGVCTLTLGGSGELNWGSIPTPAVVNQYVHMDSKALNYTIVCETPAKVAIKLTDNQRASRVPEAVAGAAKSFGLGSVSGTNIGSYTVKVNSVGSINDQLIDSAAAQLIVSSSAGLWSDLWGTNWELGHEDKISWRGGSGTANSPDAFTRVVGRMTIAPSLNKDLPLTNAIVLNGSMTLTLEYL